MSSRLFSFVLVALALLLSAQPAEAQFWDKVKDAAQRGAERAAERETAKRADRAVTEAFGLAEDAVVCAVTDETCIEEAQADGQDVVVVDEDGEPLPASQQPSVQAREATAAEAEADAPMRPGEGVWANYDFVPGQRVLFFDDFGDEYVGDFPRRFEFLNGNAEVVEWEGQRLLRINDEGGFMVPLPEPLPEQFTIEFDYHNPNRHAHLYLGTSETDEAANSESYPYHRFVVSPEVGGVGVRAGEYIEDMPASSLHNRDYMEQVLPIRIAVDGSYVKMYVDEKRVANLPNAEFNHTDRLEFRYGGFGGPAYLGNLRVAAGGRDRVYERLVADGRYTTRGILFDTGSATIQPESTPTLKEIARALQQNADLRLRIEGHTDNTGSADANQQLSERRAAAVRDYLVQQESIDPSRLEAAGIGQTAPVADNATPEGRQTNRRVELVVL